MKKVYDKKGIPVECGDIVKIFLFENPNKRKVYGYKQAFGYFGARFKIPVLHCSHLDFDESPIFVIPAKNQIERYWEIVSSLKDDHMERVKKV
jgi:hypothetical protein